MRRPHPCHLLWTVTLLLLAPLTAAWAQEEGVPVTLGWAASPTIDEDGAPLAEAVRYEVFVQRGGAAEELVATVEDTFYTLQAARGVLQRVRVVGYDATDRPSPASEWSDPIYFDADRSSPSDLTPPAESTLEPNFPNPFNPETRIAYGVPEGVDGGTPMALEIYTVRGQRVRSFSLERSPGWHEVTWDGRDDRGQIQATGTYITRYVCGERVQIGKMTMVK